MDNRQFSLFGEMDNATPGPAVIAHKAPAPKQPRKKSPAKSFRKPATFQGAAFDPKRDGERLTTQLGRVRAAMEDRNWRTVSTLCMILQEQYPDARFPENSVQAQLRNLRKGGHTVERRHVTGGLFEYRLIVSQKAAA